MLSRGCAVLVQISGRLPAPRHTYVHLCGMGRDHTAATCLLALLFSERVRRRLTRMYIPPTGTVAELLFSQPDEIDVLVGAPLPLE